MNMHVMCDVYQGPLKRVEGTVNIPSIVELRTLSGG